jgi:hypothetical protein
MCAAFVLLVSAPALADHSWNDYHWSGDIRTPTVTGSTSLNLDIEHVVSEWRLEPRIQPSYSPSGNGDIKVVAKRGNPNWIGMAQIKIDSDGHILEGKVTLNSFYANYENDSYSNADIWTHVLCQEIGHILGLDHTGGVTCMNSGAELGQHVEPGVHDFEQLGKIYEHTNDLPTPEPEPDRGGPDCTKSPNAKKCRSGAGQWITVHVFSMPASAAGR